MITENATGARRSYSLRISASRIVQGKQLLEYSAWMGTKFLAIKEEMGPARWALYACAGENGGSRTMTETSSWH